MFCYISLTKNTENIILARFKCPLNTCNNSNALRKRGFENMEVSQVPHFLIKKNNNTSF